jgi:hypothetical protein
MQPVAKFLAEFVIAKVRDAVRLSISSKRKVRRNDVGL